ncbi:MAG: T9SS type A sorting domain-containing protein [Chitinispirillia bacterium]|jgi:hypothetical protein
MRKCFLVIIFTAVLGGLFTIQAQNGFVVWTEGGHCSRALMFNKIEEGKLGPKQVCCEKQIADSWVNISYDGVWIVFCRVDQAFGGSYGKCDYHSFNKWDVYIAKIDHGKSLPATPIKVDRGYFPIWGMDENAKNPGKPKLLYYTRYGDQTIRKAVINPDGSIASKDVIHSTCPRKVQGTDAHTQGSPDGKFILYRPGKMKVYSVELKKDISGNLGGCHPAWGPRSRYFIRASNGAFLNLGTEVKSMGRAGVGQYWHAFSNDTYYDEGKLWVIGRMGGPGYKDQTRACPIKFTEVDISNDGWKLGKATDVGTGVTADIHIYGPEGMTKINRAESKKNRPLLTYQIKGIISGSQLIVDLQGFTGTDVELFNIHGKRVAYKVLSGPSQNSISLGTIPNGTYFLKLNNGKKSVLESVIVNK